ncbi:hypothetical protein MNBD_GAMMA10-900 [hydrothermal vent metagenome]|uniref:Uncharacterized protein n=1 Tax=hydrothermal vent metagenome TaxID=652676 RepID=A0A3B0XSV3_9ZZZZ
MQEKPNQVSQMPFSCFFTLDTSLVTALAPNVKAGVLLTRTHTGSEGAHYVPPS